MAHLGRVVQKAVNANLGLKLTEGGKMKDPVPIPKTFRFVLFSAGASKI